MSLSTLIIDDSTHRRKEIRSVLGRAGLFDMFYEANDGIKGLKMMLSNMPDLIICDLVMPNFDGFQFLRLKNEYSKFKQIPVLIVTGTGSANDKINVLEGGAQDYVTVPFDPLEFVARVKAHLRVKLLHDELMAETEKLRISSNTDSLTGLYNKGFFVNSFKNEFERAKRYNRDLSLLMIDMDHFKSINDRHGHLTGDRVLTLVAKIFQSDLRKVDVCARYGGDEFVVMLPETGVKGAVTVAQRYVNKMMGRNLSGIDGNPKATTFSIGIASLPDERIQNIDDFIQYADQALYISKKAGRNRITFFNKKGKKFTEQTRLNHASVTEFN
jgi:diguanylate cyclase (GGDEF)-like protein